MWSANVLARLSSPGLSSFRTDEIYFMVLGFHCLLHNSTLSFGGLLGHALWACAMSPDFSGEALLSLFYFQIHKIKGLYFFSFLWVYSEKF